MSDRPNALQMPPAPGYEDNPLMGGATLADAWDANRQSYADWLARDRQRQIDLGYVDPQTGQLTPEGWRAQAQIIGGGFGPADIGMAGGGLLGTIKAYHGSPHEFAPTPKNPLGEFDLAKIGTGEGNQAFGKGMYVAEAEGVAREGYRDRLSVPTVEYGGKDIAHLQYAPDAPAYAVGDIVNSIHEGTDPKAAIDRVNNGFVSHEKLFRERAAAETDPRKREDFLWEADMMAQGRAWVEKLDPAKFSRSSGGHMYEVNLNAEPEDFLHWDKRLSEQSPKVQQILSDKFGLSVGKNIDPTGGAIYEHSKVVPGQYRDPVAAATALREAGIPGIRYLDAGSRAGGGSGTHNYAVFNPEIMDIIRRYGIAGLLGGGAAATAAGGQDQGNQ